MHETTMDTEASNENRMTGTRRYLSTMDLLTMAAVSVVGALFSAHVWSALMNIATPLFAFLGPVGWIGASGVYLIWPVIVGLLIAKPGAVTLYTLVQGFVEMLFGSAFGALAIVYAGAEGLGVDLGMGLFKWKARLPGVLLGAGIGCVIVDEIYIFLFGLQSTETILIGGVTAFISGVLLGGLPGWLITQALRRTGAVSRFGSDSYETLD